MPPKADTTPQAPAADAATLNVQVIKPTADQLLATPGTQTAGPQPGTPEYDAAMIAKAQGQAVPTAPAAAPAEPTTPPAEAPAPAADPKDATLKIEPPPAAEDKAAQEAVATAGLDWSALETEVASTGKLGDASYAALAKAGIPKTMVDAYVEGRLAVAARAAEEVFASVGGRDQYTAMTAWAENALSQAERDTFNRVIDSGDRGMIDLAVAGLQARYRAAVSNPPAATVSRSPTVPGATQEGFQSWTEVRQAMADPRYAKDPAYIREVEAKMARSTNLRNSR